MSHRGNKVFSRSAQQLPAPSNASLPSLAVCPTAPAGASASSQRAFTEAGGRRARHWELQLQQNRERRAGDREITVKELQKLSKLFDMTLDQIVNSDGDIPKEVTLQDKSNMEQLNLINQLDDEDRDTVFKVIDTMLTKKKFKDFFQKNVAPL